MYQRQLSLRLSLVFAASLITASALAQPRPRGRPAPPPPAPATVAPAPDPGRGGAAAAPNAGLQAKACAAKQSFLSSEGRKLDDSRAVLAGINAEIAQAQSRLEYLEARRLDMTRELAGGEVRQEIAQANYKAECSQDESCEQYERMSQSLDVQSKPNEEELERIRTDIGQTRTDNAELHKQIEPLRRDYQSLACNNLVPGETAQTTIDRCTAIFSDWNRLQARLNGANNRLTTLQARYQQIFTDMQNTERRAKTYEDYLAANCKGSPQLSVVRRYRGVREKAAGMQRDLDSLIEDVTKLRGIRITATAQ